MLSIFAPTKYHQDITAYIQAEFRLEELVRIVDYLEERPIQQANNLLVREDAVFPLLDWYNLQPPYILPESLPLDVSHLLGMIFAKLNNFEKTFGYLSESNPSLFRELDFINRMQQNIAIDPQELLAAYTPFDEYRLMHNQAVVRHYTSEERYFEIDKIKYFYLEALQAAPNAEYRAFSARHFALLLLDRGEFDDAQRLIKAAQSPELSLEAKTALTHTLCQIWMAQLTVPYDPNLLQQLKGNLWDVLQVYEKQNRSVDQAFAYSEAGIIANYSESWAESLKYFNQAIALFEQEKLPLLVAEVQYRKGTLLYTWAQKDNPQFYRGASESYQHALKIFNRCDTPEIFAQIQHHLGIIYSQMPDDPKKRGIWAAVSSTAFQEALEIYTQEQFPYEYAAVCNHYGNALLKYPDAKLTDNVEKALFYYQEALKIRTADQYPFERCMTLLNYLEAQWHLGMENDEFQEQRYDRMQSAAREVLNLNQNTELNESAEAHLEQLKRLKAAYA